MYTYYTIGDVIYSTVTFVDKNRDELPKEAGALLAGSSVGLIRDVFTALQVFCGVLCVVYSVYVMYNVCFSIKCMVYVLVAYMMYVAHML